MFKPAWNIALRWFLSAIAMALALALMPPRMRTGRPAINDPDEPTFQRGALKMFSGVALNPGRFRHPALAIF